jgi:hypothetical protein
MPHRVFKLGQTADLVRLQPQSLSGSATSARWAAKTAAPIAAACCGPPARTVPGSHEM